MFKKKPTESKTIDRSNIYTTGQIGRTRETTPEGYLLCRDVPIARIGKLMYGDGEVPVTADNTGLIIIERGEDILFDPVTIASAESKPVTDNHPDDWVTPDNWKELSKGSGQNVHRGDGVDSDYLMADLLITDRETIKAVEEGKVEISLGYDADYIEISKGKGLQSNIRVNHIALVDKGRCGSRCSIGDSFMSNKTKKQKKPWYQALLGAKRTIDEALEEAEETKDSDDDSEEDDSDDDKGKTSDTAVNRQILKMLKTMDSRLGALEKKSTKDSDESDDDNDTEETKDDVLDTEGTSKLSQEGVQNHTGDSLKDVIARAEVLVPGIKLPTFDSANNGQSVLNAKRIALKQAYATADGQKVITPFIGDQTNFDTLPAHTVDAAFIGASELMKQHNNNAGVRHGISTKDFGRQAPSIADINAKNRAYWNKGK